MSDPNAAPPPSPDKAGLLEDFVDIFGAPAKVFARRATAGAAAPFFIITLLVIAIFFANRNVMAPIMDAEMTKAIQASMKDNPNIPPEALERAKGIGSMMAAGGAVVAVPIGLLILGLVTFVVARIAGGSPSYGTSLMITCFAWVPRMVEGIVGSVQGILLDTSKMTSHFQMQIGPARFFDPDTTPAWQLGLLGRVDLFTLWVTLLFAIGIVYAGKAPRSKLILAGALMWVIGSIPAILSAIRTG